MTTQSYDAGIIGPLEWLVAEVALLDDSALDDNAEENSFAEDACSLDDDAENSSFAGKNGVLDDSALDDDSEDEISSPKAGAYSAGDGPLPLLSQLAKNNATTSNVVENCENKFLV